jgi:hypothetical protein
MSHTLCPRASVFASSHALVHETAQRRAPRSWLTAQARMGRQRVPQSHDRRGTASAAPRGVGSSIEFGRDTLRNHDSLSADVPSGDLSTHLEDGYR